MKNLIERKLKQSLTGHNSYLMISKASTQHSMNGTKHGKKKKHLSLMILIFTPSS